jgi:hypothetical protein
MLKEFLSQVQQESTFEMEIFAGQLVIRARILSPSEIEKASLSNSLVLQALAKSGELEKFQQLGKDLNSEDATEQTLDRAYQMLSKVRPEHIDKINRSQDQLIAMCITHAKQPDQDQFERLQIVLNQQDQNADRNMLWVGMIPKVDRSAILDRALNGHSEAVERLATFRR